MKLAAKALIALVLLATPALCAEDGPARIFASVGTGAMNGVYYPVAGAICALVDQSIRATSVRCSPETTPGSVYNLDGLRSGELDFAIVQSDVAYDAYEGKGAFAGRPMPELRSVLTLHPELVTIVARPGVADIAALGGGTIYVGPEGSGTRHTWAALAAAADWPGGRKPEVAEIAEDSVGAALCSGSLDAAMLMVGHPSRKVGDLLKRCALTLVPVKGPAVEKLLATAPYWRKGDIDGASYGMDASPSVGVDAVLVTTAAMDDRAVAAFAKAVASQIEVLRSKHPALAHLKLADTTTGALPAPLHPAAADAYRQITAAK